MITTLPSHLAFTPFLPTLPSHLGDALQVPLLALIVIIITAVWSTAYLQKAMALFPNHSNLVVCRTMSKWAGLAGLRLGLLGLGLLCLRLGLHLCVLGLRLMPELTLDAERTELRRQLDAARAERANATSRAERAEADAKAS